MLALVKLVLLDRSRGLINGAHRLLGFTIRSLVFDNLVFDLLFDL
jgi:hypothetical protein